MMKLGAVFIVHIDGALASAAANSGLPRKSMLPSTVLSAALMAVAFFAAAVEGEDALGDGVVKNGVGIAVGLDVATDGLQRFQVKEW